MSTYEQILQSNPIRSRGWCFTINNFSEQELENVKDQILRAKYGIAETEHTGEGEGTPHIQGYIYFDNSQTFNRIKILLGERAHIEPAKGSPQQNYEYCSKEGTVFIERPIARNKGSPSFLEMYEDMKKLSPEEFEQKYPKFWTFHRDKVMTIMIDSAMKHVENYDGNLKEKNIWLWGEPGLGKSRWASLQGSYSEIFKKNFNKWWDGYSLISTKIVIIEDYPSVPAGNALVQHIKIWGDRYPFEAECKGSHLMVEPRRFFLIITSNYPIERCFENEEDIRAIRRRFKEIEIKQGDFYNQGIFKLDRKIIS